MKDKIKSIEGLRTIGWIGVFTCHFRGAFLPTLQLVIDKTPLKFIYSGNEYVRLFFVISGFLLALKFLDYNEIENLDKEIIKRYLRLMPLILFSEIIVYCFMKLNLLRNIEAAEITGSADFLAMINSNFMDKLLGNKFMVFGGKISYAAYIIHWPIIEILSSSLLILLHPYIHSYNFLSILIFTVTLGAVVLISFLMNKYIEPIGNKLSNNLNEVYITDRI